MDGTRHHARTPYGDLYSPFFMYNSIHRNIISVIRYHLIKKKIIIMSNMKFDINVANSVAIVVANDVLPVW